MPLTAIDELNAKIDDFVNTVEAMPASARDALLEKLLAAAADRKANATRVPLRTPMQCAADPRSKQILITIAHMLARAGVDLKPDKLVDMRAVEKAFKESNTSLDERFAIKTELAKLNLCR